jgi:hypothetical protein
MDSLSLFWGECVVVSFMEKQYLLGAGTDTMLCLQFDTFMHVEDYRHLWVQRLLESRPLAQLLLQAIWNDLTMISFRAMLGFMSTFNEDVLLQVSVRKAAMVAISRLLELFPLESIICQAWVRSVLPLVRDVESTIQDSMLDWSSALLLDRAAEARLLGAPAKAPKGRAGAAAAAAAANAREGIEGGLELQGEEQQPQSAAAEAAAELKPLLAAVAGVGRSAAACLAKLCGLVAGKKKLKAKSVAQGLEALIQSSPMGCAEAVGAWMLLKEVSGQDAAAPSWQFLQQRWKTLQAAAAVAGGAGGVNEGASSMEVEEGLVVEGLRNAAGGDASEEGALLLLVISNAAESFPPAQAAALGDELLKVRSTIRC